MGDDTDTSDEVRRLRALVAELEASFLRGDAAVQSIASNSPDNVMLLDTTGRIQFINRTVPDLTVDRVLGVPVFEFVPEEYRAAMKKCFERVLATGRPDRYDTAYVAEDGSVSFWESRVGAVKRGDDVVGFSVISSNVTERRQAAADRDQFFNLSVDMLCVAGMDGYFKRLNPAFARVLGHDEAELLSAPILDFVHPEDRARTLEAMARLEGGHDVIDFENRYRCKSGEYRVLSWRAAPDTSRKLMHAVARDVTERRTLEAQLRQAQKMEAIGQLAGGLAHDFNNMILAIQANADFAARENDPVRRGEFISEVKIAAKRASDLTRQLLTFGRRQRMNPIPLDLGELALDLVRLLRRLIPESIDIDVINGHELGLVHADPGQMEQVIVNLCVNARDAMPKGGRLTIETENVLINGRYRDTHPWSIPGRYVLVTVSDTGTGIAPEVRERMFEPFFTTKEPGKGTGLGLATVYGIVRHHGGFVHVYSELGRGTTFKVYLPVTERRAGEIGPKITERVEGGTETILVAEDEDAVRRVLVAVLEKAGYTVLVAKNGAEAVEIFSAQGAGVDLLLFDVVMPVLGGPDALEEIRAQRSDVPVLFASGYSSRGLGEVPEPKLIVPKPFEPDELLRSVRALLDGARQGSRRS